MQESEEKYIFVRKPNALVERLLKKEKKMYIVRFLCSFRFLVKWVRYILFDSFFILFWPYLFNQRFFFVVSLICIFSVYSYIESFEKEKAI